jgi:hypothetical protein
VKKILIVLFAPLYLFTTLESPADAESLVNCISATAVSPQGFEAHGAFFQVQFQNECSGVDIGSVTATLVAGGARSTQSFYLTYGSEEEMFDTFATLPGYWDVSVNVSIEKDFSSNSLDLGTFYDSGSQTQVQNQITGKQICIAAPSGQPQCVAEPNFYWSVCSTNPQGILYSENKNSWIKVWSISGKKNSACSSKYPFLVAVQGSTKQTSGSNNLKIIFSPFGKYGGYTQYLTLKIG